jgi:hypothetical protein
MVLIFSPVFGFHSIIVLSKEQEKRPCLSKYREKTELVWPWNLKTKAKFESLNFSRLFETLTLATYKNSSLRRTLVMNSAEPKF